MKKQQFTVPSILYILSFSVLLILSPQVKGNIPDENTIRSNVPLNEISGHAFRHFRRHFPTISGESWYKSGQGYLVSFTEHSLLNQVHYDRRGGFLYSLKYYSGAAIDKETGVLIKKRFMDYQIDVVTEITNGETTFYLVTIKSPSFVKTLSVCDGKIEILNDLINGA